MAERTCFTCGRTTDSAPTPWTFISFLDEWSCADTECLENAADTAAQLKGEWKPLSADVKRFNTTLDDAMLDAINALPEEDRPTMCDAVRDALTDAPKYRIVDGEAQQA